MEVSSYIFQNPYSQPVQIGRPDPAMIQERNQKRQEELDTQQKNSTKAVDAQSNELSPLAIKSSSVYQNDASYGKTAVSVNEFTALFKEAQRAQNITAYVSNSADFATA